MKKLMVTASLSALLSMGIATAHADTWRINADSSVLNFVSVKNETVAETHRFTDLSGAVTDGKLEVSIPVASIDTQIPIRNERMLKHIFNSEEYSTITVTSDLDMPSVDAIPAGSTLPLTVDLDVFLAGTTGKVEANLQVTRLDADELLVTTTSPVLISANTFKFSDGVEQLRTIAGLNSIDLVVPVTFSVQLTLD
ncbi:YceI family protein [Pseudidiomarina aestuarii]|uniref:YceI family protein n=1 Tax=Pseudidiomarina aestuarii TaxID=624146 RepID=UPI003A97F157